MSAIETAETSQSMAVIHPAVVRATHWVKAAATLILLMSGLEIYNAAPILPFKFPAFLTLGGWLGGALLWHLAAMWLLAANLALMIGYGIVSGRYGHKLLPLSPAAVITDLKAAARGQLAHEDVSRYNAVQKLFYLGVLTLLMLVILSGLALWKPVQLSWLTALLGGFQGARLVHFLAMCGIALFIIVHVAMAVLVPKSLRAMLRGR